MKLIFKSHIFLSIIITVCVIIMLKLIIFIYTKPTFLIVLYPVLIGYGDLLKLKLTNQINEDSS